MRGFFKDGGFPKNFIDECIPNFFKNYCCKPHIKLGNHSKIKNKFPGSVKSVRTSFRAVTEEQLTLAMQGASIAQVSLGTNLYDVKTKRFTKVTQADPQ